MQLVYIGFYSLEVEENRSTCLVFVLTCTHVVTIPAFTTSVRIC